MELNTSDRQFTYIDECKSSLLGAIYDSVAMVTTDGDVTDGATLDCGDVGVAHHFIVQEHGGVTVQVLQCVGQSGTGDGPLPASGVVHTCVAVDMALGIGCPTTQQTDQLKQHQERYLRREKKGTEGGGGDGRYGAEGNTLHNDKLRKAKSVMQMVSLASCSIE